MSDVPFSPGQGSPEMLAEYAYTRGRTALAENVLSVYAGSEEKRDFMHPVHVRDLMKDFLGGDVNPFLFDVALFHDVADRAQDMQLGKNARKALHNFTQVLNDSDITFFNSVLGDLTVVEEMAEKYRSMVARKDTKLGRVMNETSNKNQPVSTKLWLEPSPMADPADMLELVKEVNLESVLLKSVEMFDNLTRPSTKEIAVLQDVFEAESFYAPLCEILGYDGIAMALRSVSAQIRLQKSGNGQYVDQAQRILEKLGTIDEVKQAVSKLFGYFGNDFDMDNVVDVGSGQHNIQIGELLHQVGAEGAEGAANDQLLRGVRRIKSVGSLAMKLFKNQGKIPTDVVALNVIVPDKSDVVRYFPVMVKALDEADDVEFVPGQKRVEPLHIRGDKSFVQDLVDAIDVDLPIDSMDLDSEKYKDETKFRVAKAMMRMSVDVTMIPIEVMVQTENDRLNSRIGDASHVAIKAKGNAVPFDHSTLSAIKARKRHLRSGRVNPRSIERGDRFAFSYAA